MTHRGAGDGRPLPPAPAESSTDPFGARPAADLAALVPGAAAYEILQPEAVDLAVADQVLLGDEGLLVVRAVANRRRQFAAGRHCAHLAMAGVGLTPAPILAGPQRAPRWPAGVNGTISHTEGYAIAVVRRSPDAAGAIGVDAEVIGRVGPRLYDRLFTPVERAWLDQLDPARRAVAATAVFGAKEAFYKAQFAHTAAWVSFHDVASRPVDPERPVGGGLIFEPATNLPALRGLRWPTVAQHLRRGRVLLSLVEVDRR